MSSGILKGALWSVLMRMSVRGLGVISLLILARIFTPEQFGLIAKAVLFKEVLELITQVGIEAALIRNKDAKPSDYNTAWTLTIIRGAAICLLLVLFAPSISIFFAEPLLQELIWAYALSMLIRGFINIGVVDLRKNMTFHLDFNFNMIIKLAEFIPTLLIALLYESVWAFPIGVLSGSIIALLISYHFSKRKLSLGVTGFKEFFHFGKWMLVHEFSSAIATKFDTFLLGRLSTNERLGVYTVGNEIATLPVNEVALPVGRASLPGLSKITKNDQLKNLNTQTLLITLAIAFPMSFGISSVSYELVAVILGKDWQDAAALIQILAFLGPITVISALSISAIIVKNKVKQLAFVSFINFIFRSFIIYIAYIQYDLLGVCFAVVLTGFIRSLCLFLLQLKSDLINFQLFIKEILRPLSASIIMYLVVEYLKTIVDTEILILKLLIFVLAGALTYAIITYLLWLIAGKPEGLERFVLSKIHKH